MTTHNNDGEFYLADTIAEKLADQRRRQFVGRSPEKVLFQNALESNELPFVLFYGYGPGGVGKTSLLREFGYIAAQLDIPTYFIDARDIPPSPDSFELALMQSTGTGSPKEARLKLASQRSVLCVDTFETLQTLESWFRDVFLPSMPTNLMIAVMGRKRPSSSWISDGAWSKLAKVVGLRNLSNSEAVRFLEGQEVPASEHRALFEFTHGHPLALSLACETIAQSRNQRFVPDQNPDIINLLLERFLDQVPSPKHRQALEACALVRNTTEALLAAAVEETDAYDLFNWLKSLTFIESGPFGLYPHDLARKAISMELKWRNIDDVAKLHDRARAYYADHLERTSGAAQQAVLSDYIYLHRDNPTIKPFFDWNLSASYVDSARPTDFPQILQIVEANEGKDSARIARMWLESTVATTQVLRNSLEEGIAGFLMTIEASSAPSELISKDPGTQACMSYLQERAPLRAGERALIYRFWMTVKGYQDVSPDQSLLFVTIVHWSLTTPNLGHTFQVCANPDFYSPMFEYANVPRILPADFQVSGVNYGSFGHDWRAMPMKAWLALLSEREVPVAASAPPTITTTEWVVLSRPGFEAAIAKAFKGFLNASRLADNPLLRSRVVLDRLDPAVSEKARIKALREAIYEASRALSASSKDAKLYAALETSYFKPAKSQEAAAEQVDVSIASYRRHLKAGVARVVEHLWQLETGS